MDDSHWMRRALLLAERGRGAVEPNPLVGAVLVRDGAVVGEGWHQRYGDAHAEVNAIRDAGSRASGATLYVTLEPCSHFGKTPPCADAVIAAGVVRVVAAMTDPFPQVAGQGLSRLREAGIAVDVGIEEAAARRLNRPYLTLLRHARPCVHLKWAMSLDGRVATRTGNSQWISGESSRRRVHELRGRVDAVIVGAGTVRVDDPLLTARPPGPRNPARVVVSTQPTLPAGCQLLRTPEQGPVIVAAREPGTIPGAEVIVVDDVPALLAELGRRRMTNVLLEGGPRLAGSFLTHRLVDECHIFVAPILIGGDGVPATVGEGVGRVADALRLSEVSIEPCDGDTYIRGIVPADD